jgi:hypothetical protein
VHLVGARQVAGGEGWGRRRLRQERVLQVGARQRGSLCEGRGPGLERTRPGRSRSPIGQGRRAGWPRGRPSPPPSAWEPRLGGCRKPHLGRADLPPTG